MGDDNQNLNNQTDEAQDQSTEQPETVAREDFENLQTEFDQMQSQFNEMTSQLKRAVADYQNLEKRVNEGRKELVTWTTGELIGKLLPVLDHLDKSVTGATEAEKQSGWFKGVEMSLKQLHQVLQSEGLDEIGTDGQFDPTLHEAVDIREGEDNKILEVARKGYLLSGKVLRPAQVVVGKKGGK